MSTSQIIRGYSDILVIEHQILSNKSYIFGSTCVSLRMKRSSFMYVLYKNA